MAAPPDAARLDRPWAGSYPPGVPLDYRFPAVAVTRFLDDAVRDFPQHDAVVTARATMDYVTFGARVGAVSAALVGTGIGPGAHVLVALPNQITTPVVLFALWQIEAVVVAVDPELPADRMAAIAADAAVEAVVGTGHVLSSLRARDVAATTWLQSDGQEWPPARRRWPVAGAARRLTAAGRRLGWSGRWRLARRAAQPRDDHAAQAAGAARHAPVQLVDALAGLVDGDHAASTVPLGRPRPDQPAVIQYDGGREPCGVVLSHANLVASAFQARLWLPDVQAGRERVLVVDRFHDLVPLTLGLLTAVLAAATVVLADESDATGLGRVIDRDAPTLLTTRVHRLRSLVADGDLGKRDLTSLRVVLACGAPLDPDLAVDLERLTDGARLRGCSGAPGAGPLTHAQPVYGRVVAGSMGLPVTSTVAIVVDPADHETVREPGVPGLLVLHGPQVASGYWRRDGLEATRFVGGWLVTDDVVTADAGGTFRYVGPHDEVVDHDGALMWPRRVEATLERHPGVRRAGVVRSPDGALLAAVQTRRRLRPEPDALIEYCRTHLDSPAVPDRVIVVPSLPHTEAGELARDELSRDLFSRLP